MYKTGESKPKTYDTIHSPGEKYKITAYSTVFFNIMNPEDPQQEYSWKNKHLYDLNWKKNYSPTYACENFMKKLHCAGQNNIKLRR